jgi:hypothetical protein
LIKQFTEAFHGHRLLRCNFKMICILPAQNDTWIIDPLFNLFHASHDRKEPFECDHTA